MTIGNINAFAEETVELGQAYGYAPYGYGGVFNYSSFLIKT
ncbi:MAG TPA: hypothetical protein VJ879_07865 [Desulfobacter sp.]|nr:hypothetical protein [Desulfobacter sp.]